MNDVVKGIGTFAVAVVLFKGLVLVETGTNSDLVWGLILICIVAVILWFTVDFWSRWLFAFCSANVLRCAVMGVVGRTTSYPSMQAPRLFFWGMAGIFAVMTFELYPFLRRRPNLFERFSLILAPIGLAYSFLGRATIMWMLVPALFLVPSTGYRFLIRHDAKSELP